MKWSALAERVHQSIKRRNLLQEGDKILVAVSGGMDSIVLLHVLLELRDYWKWELVVGHIDHGLRPSEDEKEAQLCSKIAGTAGLEYFEVGFDLENIKIDPLPGSISTQKPSLESLARDLRYRAYESWAHQLNCNAVCTGHHRGDQAETILYRMLTGSGPKGLGGIPASRDIYKRPLLEVSKDDIRDYAKEKELEYYEDSSNKNNRFMRNRIRRQLIPFLKKLGFENAEQQLSSAGKTQQEVAEALEYYGDRALEKALSHSTQYPSLNIKYFNGLPVFTRKYVLKKVCKEHLFFIRHISDKQLDQLISFIVTAETGAKTIFMGTEILVDRGRAIWRSDPKAEILKTVSLKPGKTILGDVGLEVEFVNKNKNENLIPDNDNTAYFTQDVMNWECRLRSWQPGDSMMLFGNGQRKKVSDILKDEKVSALEKTDYPVLMTGGDIIWIPGVKRSNLYKVNPNDDQMIKITYSKMEKDNDQKDLNT